MDIKDYCTAAGGIAGSPLGLIGGVGVAGAFGAFGIPALALSAVGIAIGGLTGRAVGEVVQHFTEENTDEG